MQVKVIEKPEQEYLSLDFVKEYLRVDHDAEDRVISDLIPAAREIVQVNTGYYIGPQKIRTIVPLIKRKGRPITPRSIGYLCGRTCIRLPLSPIISIDKVKVIDFDGKETEVPSHKYHPNLNVYPSLIILDYVDQDTAIIELTVGTEELTSALKQRILIVLADLYENRGNIDYSKYPMPNRGISL
jgi:hypothetical protein